MANSQLVSAHNIPNIVIDLKYATAANVFKKQFYFSNKCLVHATTFEALQKVQKRLNDQGKGLKVWDAYRPQSVQQDMWNCIQNPLYVAPPGSTARHARGTAVDVTLIDLRTREELEMPTEFDTFTEAASATYEGCSPQAKRNRTTLIQNMTEGGFKVLPTEWWHFDLEGWEHYPIVEHHAR